VARHALGYPDSQGDIFDCPRIAVSGLGAEDLVLSIGKLAAGQASYYLDQAEVRVDAVESIGDGIEEYYSGGAEARGRWVGTGAVQLGLSGVVGGEALRRVLAGLDPEDSSPLRCASSAVRVAGFDLTFSAPKSVSVIFAIGDLELRAAVRSAHDRAVLEAVAYLERSAAAVRRGHGGERVERAEGLVAAAFRHRTSRAGDPQLHTHVLVANLGRGPDGRWSALDGRRLYAHARAASFIYQAVLRSELTRTLGLEWLPVRKGIAELVGVPKPVLRAFSRRRAEIEAALEERGSSSPRAAEAAALATRRAKRGDIGAAELVAGWRARAAELGWGRDDLARLLGRVRGVEFEAATWERLFDQLASPTGLTRRASTFSRRDVIQALCEILPTGARAEAQALEGAADRFLASPRVVALLPDTERDAFRRRDGRLLPLRRDELVYSTPELLALEQRVIDQVSNSWDAHAGVTHEAAVADAVAARPTLSGEQKAMVERLCLDGEGVSVVVGKAGTGKTFALAAAREAWQAEGVPVLGVAVARRAARELEQDAGIASTSVAALLGALSAHRPTALPERCVLVVDEAGMLPTRRLAELVDSVAAIGGKLVLVGDHRQLPELEAGGAFRGLVRRGLAVELSENRRQVNAWERAALDHVRDGRPERALVLYRAHDRVHIDDTPERSRARLVEDWWATGDQSRTVMLAQRRDDVADLNARAREHLRAAGMLQGPELHLPGGTFAVGDRVIVKRNDFERGLVNGERGRVTAIDHDAHRLTIDCQGVRIALDAEYLEGRTVNGDPTLQHGYASTIHVAQGLTVDHAFVLAGPGLNRELGYTALSRGRHSNRLYAARDPHPLRAEFAPTDARPDDPFARLAGQLGTSSAHSLAIDVGHGEPDGADRLAAALRDHATASARRRAAEHARTRWLPQRRRQIQQLRSTEAAAAGRVADLRREDHELRHGARPFVTGIDDRFADARDQLAERRLRREVEAGRDVGRGLER
jgi:conjugative relaxase-like TrwC/TraI family protein